MTKEQDVKVARTESLFRGVNERIAETADRSAVEDVSFVCECSDPTCTDRIHATLDEYEEVRSDGAQHVRGRSPLPVQRDRARARHLG